MVEIENIKRDLVSNIGSQILIKERKFWGNDVIYDSPVVVNIVSYTDNFITTKSDKGYLSCYRFNDFFCGDFIYKVVTNIKTNGN